MGLVVLIALPIIRGLYDAVSFLLALALCALLAWGAVIGLRLARQERVVVGRRALKEGGSLTWAGWGASAILLGATALTGQAGIVRYHLLFGNAALRELAGDASDSLEKPPPGAAGASPRALNSSAPLDRAIRHFEQAAAWGLVQPRSLTLRLAALDLQAGSPAKARDKLNALVADDPHDPEARLLTARAWIAEGRAAIASQCLESLIRDERVAAPSRDARRIVLAATAMLADVAASAGRYEEALRHYEGCLSLDSRDAGALMGRGVMLAAVGRHAEAAESFRNILDQDPRSAGAHNNLAASLVRLDQPQEALAHYQRALEIVPDHPVAASNAAQLLLDAGRLDAAESLFQRILKRNSADAAAEAGIAEIRRRRAQAGDPGGMDR